MDCPDNFTMTADKTCSLRVGNKIGVFEVGMKNRAKGTVRVMNESRMIIVTDIDRLMSRYGNNKEEVNAVLKATYQRANEQEGVVYNLGDYLDNSQMWKTLTEYKEEAKDYAVK
jgi:dihydroorotate dehydrogenase